MTAILTETKDRSTSPSTMAEIEAVGLEKTYQHNTGRAAARSPITRALDGLSISVPSGTIFGLLGPNGAGKSTTVKVLTTLTHADAGSARVGGFSVFDEPQRVREVIGVVAQKSGVDEEATGRENLELQGRLYGLRGTKLDARVDELLDRFGLANAADRIGKGYSGGMKRRLGIAMGLVHKPRVLFLDEPTTGLDPQVRAAMWEEIRELAEGERMTILLTTHYLEEADRLAQNLAIVDRGRVVAEGTPSDLKLALGVESLDDVYLRYAGRSFQEADDRTNGNGGH